MGPGRGSGGRLGGEDRVEGHAALDQPVDRILTSLDRLGERIRALSANRDDTPPAYTARRDAYGRADERPGEDYSRDRAGSPSIPAARRGGPAVNADLQRAIEEIARRRDTLERTRPVRSAEASRPQTMEERYAPERSARPADHRSEAAPVDRRDMPVADRRTAAVMDDMRGELRDIKRSIERFDPSGHTAGMSEISRRIETLSRSVADGRSVTMLREEVSNLRESILENTSSNSVKALTATYDEILRRLDQMHGVIDSPKAMADVVQRLGEVRKLLGGMVTEAQAGAILGRIDGLAERLDGAVDRESLGALEVQVVSLAQAVAGLDQTQTVAAIEASLGEVIDQLSSIDDRLSRLGDVERWSESLERSNATLSQLAQRTEQLPRVAHEMERQSASVEGLVKATEPLPRMAKDIEALRKSVDPVGTAKGIEFLGNRLDGISEKLEGLTPSAELSARIADITGRLDHLNHKTETLPRFVDALARQTATIEKHAETVDGLSRRIDVLPKLAADVTEIRRTMETADPQRGIDQVIVRIDDLTDRIDRMASSSDLLSDGGLDLRLDEIVRRLDRIELGPNAPGLAHLEQHLERLAAAIEAKVAEPVPALPEEAAEALERIEKQLATNQIAEKFTALEARVADLTRLLEDVDLRAIPDIAGFERTPADLRGEVAILSNQTPADVDRELRALTDRIDRLSGPELADPAVFLRIEERIGDLIERLDNRPTEATLLADTLSRFEAILADAFHPDKIADGAVRAAAAALGNRSGSEGIAQIQSELSTLQDDLRTSAQRDRELLAAIGEAVGRLAAREPGEMRADTDIAVAEDRADQIVGRTDKPADDEDADAATWREIERTLAENIGQRPRRAAEALESAFSEPDDGARLFGRRGPVAVDRDAVAAAEPVEAADPAPAAVRADAGKTKPGKVESGKAESGKVEPVLTDAAVKAGEADGDALDLNAPLEPGSGKPARLTAKAAVAAGAAVKSMDAPRSEPSKADFIAAARRAAQAAGAELPATGNRRTPAAPAVALAGDEAKSAPKGRFALRVPALIVAHKRQVLVATLAVGVALVGTRMIVTNFLQDAPGPEFTDNAGPIEVDPAQVAETAEPQPAPVATTRETPPPASGSAAVDTPAAGTPLAEASPPSAVAPAGGPQASPDVAAASPAIPPETETKAPETDTATAGPDTGTAVASLPSSDAGDVQKPLDGPSASADGAAVGAPPQAADGGTAVASLDPGATTTAPSVPSVAADLPALPETVGPLALRQAALSGNPVAQFEVAARLTEGRGVPQNLGEAVKWYEKAADAGLAPAQYRLGSLFEKGQGVPRDTKVAAGWYAKAADVGNAKAMHNLAVLYAEGGVGQPDYDAAARWFRKAADLGVRDSQYNLGILYARGLGVPRDLTASYKWFAIAAAAGDSDSAKKRDDVAQVLDKDALARARLAVETWKAGTPDAAANDVATDDPAWASPGESTAAVVSTGDLIMQAQTLLTKHGYDVGKPDGLMGKRTRDAITAFQKEKGLPQTGTVDAGLIQALAEQAI